jgi:magnesium transporter
MIIDCRGVPGRRPRSLLELAVEDALQGRRAVVPLAVPLDRLAAATTVINPDLHEHFRDVHHHLLRTVGQVEGFRELLSSILQANPTQVSLHQNEDMGGAATRCRE